MDMSNLWEAWPIAGPWYLLPLSGGTNNTIWRADATNGNSYVLRIIANSSHIPHALYEARLLEALSDRQPPFLLPVPLKTHQGDIVASFQQKTGTTAFAIVTHLLPGNLPDRNSIPIAANAGFALAWLDNVLASLPETYIPKENGLLPTFGKLTQLHPFVPEPLLAVEHLPIGKEQAKQIQKFLASTMEKIEDLYAKLPQQLLHRDFDPGNILVEAQKVTAVLDFEFADRDIRVLDICIALSWWIVDLLGTGKEWRVLDAFGTAYMKHFPLDEAELLALPAVWRVRDAASFIHRMGRYMAGLETGARIQDRVQHSLWREAWLSTNGDKLVQHALRWREARYPEALEHRTGL